MLFLSNVTLIFAVRYRYTLVDGQISNRYSRLLLASKLSTTKSTESRLLLRFSSLTSYFARLDVVTAHDDRVLAPLYGKINNMKIAIHYYTAQSYYQRVCKFVFLTEHSHSTLTEHKTFHITIPSSLAMTSRCLYNFTAVKLNHHCLCHCFPRNGISRLG